MITKYLKRTHLGFVSQVAFVLVMLFTVNLFAADPASFTQPAKTKASGSLKASVIVKAPTTAAKKATTSKTAATTKAAAVKDKDAVTIIKKPAPKADWPFAWVTDFNKAKQIAAERNRCIMLVFSGSDWCSWCIKLDNEIFKKKEFRDYARNHVVSVMLDTPKKLMSSKPHAALMSKYGIKGWPGVVILDKNGNFLGKGGYMSGGPNVFINFLEGLIIMPKEVVAAKSLRFDRSPGAILKVLQKQMEMRDQNKKITDDDKLTMNVTLGNWKAVEDHLESLQDDDAKKVYAQLLTELKVTRNVKLAGKSTKVLKSILTLEDFFVISDFCPGTLDSGEISLLAAILKVIIGSDDYRETMLATLEKGTSRFGGTDRKKRMAAANLLFAMDMKLAGGKFLPDPETAMAEKDMATVKMLINYLAEKARAEKDASALDKAWELGQWMLLDEKSSASERQSAFSLTLSLIPTLDKKIAREWLSKRFLDEPLLGMKILVTMGDTVLKSSTGGGAQTRAKNIALLSSTVGSLLDIVEGDSWNRTLNALALCWVREAESTVGNYQKPKKNTRYMSLSSRQAAAKRKVPYIPLKDILAAAPDNRWLGRVDDDTKISVLMLKARLFMKNEKMPEAMDVIKQISTIDSSQCTAILNDYLKVWGQVANHTPLELDEYTQRMIRYGRYQGMQGIPLTRSRQVRNLKKLAEFFKLIPTITNEPVDASIAVKVFSDCHSNAEVYLKKDIEAVFGPIENIRSDVSMSLISVMRGRLSNIWQNAEAQTKAKTNRSETQMHSEVSRGYKILEELIEASEDDDKWQYHRLKAMAMYDSAEYYYSLREKDLEGDFEKYSLAEYTERRDAALLSFKRSAECYSAIAPELKKADRSVLVYLHWFYVTLGASDLAHLKRSADYNQDYLADIRDEIMKMPGELADEHMQAFGDSIQTASRQVGPDIKMRFLKASLVILGDHPASQLSRKLLAYYDELLGELKLKVRIDSDQPGSVVGSEHPFGLFIELEHTRNIERESGGFAKYLQNASTSYFVQDKIDHRDVLRNYITDALLKHFTIESLVFAKPSVKAIDLPRESWRVTPLAYCLMKVKDKSVDVIPPIQMDMDFLDIQGKVVLPLVSDILPIDAKTEPAPSPVSNMGITQVLDDRGIADGKLKLQIDVNASGIIPAFDDLFEIDDDVRAMLDGDISDFDRGLVVDQIDTESVRISPKCQRSWDLTFKIPLDKNIEFKFPVIKAAFANAKVANKRYEDADIVEAASSITIKATKVNYMVYIYGMAAIVALALLSGLLLRKRKPAAEVVSSHKLPDNVTAFTLLSFMKHIEQHNGAKLSPKELELFKIDVAALEKAYFSPKNNGDQAGQPDIDKMARKYQSLSMNLS